MFCPMEPPFLGQYSRRTRCSTCVPVRVAKDMLCIQQILSLGFHNPAIEDFAVVTIDMAYSR